MSLFDSVVTAGKGFVVKELAKKVGLSDDMAKSALALIVPALSKGLDRNSADRSGLESLLSVIQSGSHREYVDDPESLGNSETIEDGNSILGHIFGSKDVSREVAGFVSERTGIDADTIKKLLPMTAAATLGTMETEDQSESSSGGIDLKKILGTEKDPILDGIISLAGKLF
jgi:hypothetical protein